MNKLEQVRHEIELERLQDDNKALGILNDTFIMWELDTVQYNNITIKGVIRGSRKEKHYVIANNVLLEIKNSSKIYNYEVSGSAGKNTKVITELELPFSRDNTIKLEGL